MLVFNVSLCRLAITFVSVIGFCGAKVEADGLDGAEPILNIKVGTDQSEHSATLSADKKWSVEETLPSPAENCSYHLVMNDALGNAVAIWTYFDKASNRNVLDGAQLPSGGNWTKPTTISSSNENVATFDENPTDAAFKLLINDTGATAIWNAYINGSLVVRSSTLSGGVWSHPVTTNP